MRLPSALASTALRSGVGVLTVLAASIAQLDGTWEWNGTRWDRRDGG
jgi:hypothetical protein